MGKNYIRFTIENQSKHNLQIPNGTKPLTFKHENLKFRLSKDTPETSINLFFQHILKTCYKCSYVNTNTHTKMKNEQLEKLIVHSTNFQGRPDISWADILINGDENVDIQNGFHSFQFILQD